MIVVKSMIGCSMSDGRHRGIRKSANSCRTTSASAQSESTCAFFVSCVLLKHSKTFDVKQTEDDSIRLDRIDSMRQKFHVEGANFFSEYWKRRRHQRNEKH